MKFYEERYFSDVYNEVRDSIARNKNGYTIPEFTARELENLDWFFENEYGTECDVMVVWDSLRFDSDWLIDIGKGTDNWKEQEYCRWEDGKWHFFTLENEKYDPELDPDWEPEEEICEE